MYNYIMKKLIVSIFIFFFATVNVGFTATDSATGEIRRGYLGTLPDITQRFDKQRSELARPAFDNVETFRDKNELKPVPRDNPAYIDLIIKRQKISPYTKDINDAIPLVEFDFQSHYLAAIKYESRLYNPYLPYSAEGAIYSPEAIRKQTSALLSELEKTLVILKEVN